jgi:predicted DNA-binding transcriptional regulator YafY
VSEVVRLYQYKGLLSGRRAMSAEDLMTKLEISRATLKRDIAKLREQLHVPIKFDRDRGGYILEQGQGHSDTHTTLTQSEPHVPGAAACSDGAGRCSTARRGAMRKPAPATRACPSTIKE